MNKPDQSHVSGAELTWREPKPDITAYELSKLLPIFLGRPIYQADLDSMGSERRHLKV